MAQEISQVAHLVLGPIIPGFRVGADQALSVPDGGGWCEKRRMTWRVEWLAGPPPKSRLIARLPNYIELTPWFSDSNEPNATDNRKPEAGATDWGKTP